MKCFHFPKEDEEGSVSRISRVSWVRSLSIASSSADARRSEYESESRDFSDAGAVGGSCEFFSMRRSNDLHVFRIAELRLATRGFSRSLMVGEGGFGCVYRGVVTVPDTDGGEATMEVAVKQLNRHGLQATLSLSLLKLQDNAVKLSNDNAKNPDDDDERGIQRLLVYELMPNKSLEDHLLARVPSSPLSWLMRIKIARDAARGLAYLHEEMDFQFAGAFREEKVQFVDVTMILSETLFEYLIITADWALVVGTVGYAAPEYIHTGRLTAKSDVWSFGVVLYELITGRRSVDRNLPRSEQKLLDWVKPYIADSRKFHIIIDPRLEGQYCIKSAVKLVALANRCLMKQPKSRPKMSEVVEALSRIINSLDEEKPQAAIETHDIKGDAAGSAETRKEGTKEETRYRRRVFDFREIVSLRSKTTGKLDWRSWTPGLNVEHGAYLRSNRPIWACRIPYVPHPESQTNRKAFECRVRDHQLCFSVGMRYCLETFWIAVTSDSGNFYRGYGSLSSDTRSYSSLQEQTSSLIHWY
ncbi:hypothetical protein ACLOJK_029974 [Asimina triloba]